MQSVRNGMSAAAEMALAAILATAVSVVALAAIGRVEWPAFRPPISSTR